MIDHQRRAPLVLLVSLLVLGCHEGREGQPPDTGGPLVEGEGREPASDSGEGAPAVYPGELIPTEQLGNDFLARQRLSGRHGEHEFRFEAVLQLRDGVLTVLGLTPFGSKAFVLTQRGTEVEFEAYIDRELPFPPDYILQDIHRTWFWHTQLPWADQPPAEEHPKAEVAGERVSEVWSDGNLVRRTFERLDGAPAGQLRIDYLGGHRSGRPASKVVLENGWFGYRLEIETIEWKSI